MPDTQITSVAAPALSPQRLVRDRFTWQMYALLGCWAYYLNAFSPAVPLLRDDQNTSATVSALHGLALAAGASAVGLCGIPIIGAIGRPAAMRYGFAALGMGIIGFCMFDAPSLTIASTIVGSAGGTLAANVIVAGLGDHHDTLGAAAITESTGFAALMGATAPVVLAIALTVGMPWQSGILSTIVLAAVLFALFARSAANTSTVARTEPRQDPSVRLSRRYWAAWAAMVLCCSIEFCFTIWSSDMLIERTAASHSVAALTVAAIIAGLAGGRLVAARATHQHSLERILFASLACIAVGFAIFWGSTVVWASFAGLFIAGLGVGPMYPVSVARAIRAAPHAPDLAVNRGSLGLGPAMGAAPFLIGMLVDAFGIAPALMVVPALVLASGFAVVVSSRVSD